MQIKQEKRIRRHKKIRAKIYGTEERPRLCVFRSLQHIYAQLIDDEKSRVLLSVSDKDVAKAAKGAKVTKVATAEQTGRVLAKKAIEKNINKVVFDRRGIIFHGRIKALAEGARQAGLKF
jgi:large subunit ribosomal protein L18